MRKVFALAAALTLATGTVASAQAVEPINTTGSTQGILFGGLGGVGVGTAIIGGLLTIIVVAEGTSGT